MSRAELALRARISLHSVIKIEVSARPDPRISTVQRLAHALGVTVDALLSSQSPSSGEASGGEGHGGAPGASSETPKSVKKFITKPCESQSPSRRGSRRGER